MADPHRIVYSKSHFVMRLFGLPFFAAGCAMAWQAWQGNLTGDGGEEFSRLGGLLFSLPFILIGGACLFYRGATVIDTLNGRVTTWWGFLFPISRKEYPLDQIKAVLLERKVIRSKNRTSVIYPVSLIGRNEEDIDCESAGTYAKGRAEAEKVAKLLHLELRDRTSGKTVIREAGTMDESIVDRVRRLGEVLDWPELPAGSAIRYQNIDDTAIMELPPVKSSRLVLLVALVPLAFVGFFVLSFMVPFFLDGDTNVQPLGKLLIGGFLSLFIIIPLFGVWTILKRTSGTQDRLVVSWRGIELEREYKFGGTHRVNIPAEEIEELDVADQFPFPDGPQSSSPQIRTAVSAMNALSRSSRGGVYVRSDTHNMQFGQGLSREEQQWIYDAIRFILCHPPERVSLV